MIAMLPRKGVALAVLAAFTLQPIAVQAQPACVTEDEVSAIAIYSVPNIVEAVRQRCTGVLSPSGFINRANNPSRARYAALQTQVWPRAKAGMLKVLAAKGAGARSASPAPDLAMISNLPDSAVRPLVDALIVQEVAPKIQTGQCTRIERIIELAAPIDPQVAGNVLGAVIGLVNPKELPVCARGS